MVKMKRAVFIFMTALLVLLTYASTDSLARTPSASDGPFIVTPQTGGFDDDIVFSGDNGGGDADGLSGYRGKTKTALPRSSGQDSYDVFRTLLQVWWNFMVIVR